MSKNIEITINIDSNYETLYPKTLWANVDGGQTYVDNKISAVNTSIINNVNTLNNSINKTRAWKFKTNIYFSKKTQTSNGNTYIYNLGEVELGTYMAMKKDYMVLIKIVGTATFNKVYNSSEKNQYSFYIQISPGFGSSSSYLTFYAFSDYAGYTSSQTFSFNKENEYVTTFLCLGEQYSSSTPSNMTSKLSRLIYMGPNLLSNLAQVNINENVFSGIKWNLKCYVDNGTASNISVMLSIYERDSILYGI